MKHWIIIAMVISIQNTLPAQDNILDNKEIAKKIEQCLYHTYSIQIKEAEELHKEIALILPSHPVLPFLDALIIYWENFPLLPDDPLVEDFTELMDRSAELSEKILEKDPDNIEAVFFDLHARAFTTMFWADNGRPLKVIGNLDNLYRRTMQGIDLKTEFSEFYFSSGLYNYYIEAYVEAHPVYKPIAFLFKKGNKELGIKELQYAIENTVYIRNESILFMSLLQLNYEHDMEEALTYAALLYNYHPDNIYYLAHYLMILLHQDEFILASAILDRLKDRKDAFAAMLLDIYDGFLLENDLHKTRLAEIKYRSGIQKAEEFGAIADIYKAIAHAGLSRIHSIEGDLREARRQRRISASLSSYAFILMYD